MSPTCYDEVYKEFDDISKVPTDEREQMDIVREREKLYRECTKKEEKQKREEERERRACLIVLRDFMILTIIAFNISFLCCKTFGSILSPPGPAYFLGGGRMSTLIC